MESQPFLKLQSLVVLGGKLATFLPGRRHPHVCKVAYKWIPEQHDKEVVTSDQVVYIISCQGHCTHNE